MLKKLPSFRLSPFPQSDERDALKKAFSGPEIKPGDIEFRGEVIGKGATGVVYRAKVCGQNVAVKEVLPKLVSNAKSIESFKQEVQLMSQISGHPNVVLFLGACIDPQNGYILVTELCKKSLEKAFEENYKDTHSIFDRAIIAHDIAKGLTWLHEMGITHCDLKPDNLLIDIHGTWKVADFGYSRLFDDPHKLGIEPSNVLPKGAPLYMGPERLQYVSDSNYSAPAQLASDVYSFSILFWEIITGVTPFDTCRSVLALKDAVVNRKLRPPRDVLESECGNEIIETCMWNLLNEMWKEKPEERPTMHYVLQKVEEFLIEIAIGDKKGRGFWRKYFVKPSSSFERTVDWADFIGAIELELGTQLDIKSLYSVDDQSHVADLMHKVICLRHALCDRDESFVDITRFGKICDALGPWEITSADKKIKGIISRIEKLSQQKWFRPNVTREKSIQLLKSYEDGTFLVRLARDRHQFVISKKKTGEISADVVVHTYIQKNSQGFCLQEEGPYFTSVRKLVDNAIKSGIVQNPLPHEDETIPDKETILQQAAEPISRYDPSLFVEILELKGVAGLKDKLFALKKRKQELKVKIDEGDFSAFYELGKTDYDIQQIESQIEQIKKSGKDHKCLIQ